MWSGVLSFLALSPGQSLVWSDREIVYTFYKGQQQIPGPPLVMLLSPLLRVPGAWLWGTISGRVGRQYANRRRAASA
jgi:hypothetical protein